MKLNCAIVDDEPLGIQTLTYQLKNYCPEVNLVYSTTSPNDAVKFLNDQSNGIDILFLDIEMPGMNGFTLLSHLNHHDFSLVFTTAYNQYAIKAFKVSAIDYLLKPIDEEELQKAVKRVIETHDGDTQKKLTALYNQLDHASFKRIALPTMDGLEFVKKEAIKYLLSDGNYTYVHLNSGHYILCAKAIGHFEEKLIGHKEFFRIHQSHIVNLNHVTKYVKGNAGYVVMDDGKNLNVSRAKKQDFIVQFSL